jgi:hypothetical protein
MIEFPKKILVFLLAMNYSIGMEVSCKYNNAVYSNNGSSVMKKVKTLAILSLTSSLNGVNGFSDDILPHRLLSSLEEEIATNDHRNLLSLPNNIPLIVQEVCNGYFISGDNPALHSQVQYDKCIATCKTFTTKSTIDNCLLKARLLISTSNDNAIYKISSAPESVVVYLNDGTSNKMVKIPPIAFNGVPRPDPIEITKPICFDVNGDGPCDNFQTLITPACRTALNSLGRNITSLGDFESIIPRVPACGTTQLLEFKDNYNNINVYNMFPGSQKVDIHTTNTLTGTYYDYTFGLDSNNGILNIDMEKTFSPINFQLNNGTDNIPVNLENNVLKMPMADCFEEQAIFIDQPGLESAISVCKKPNGLQIDHRYKNFISIEKTNFSNVNKRALGFLNNQFRFLFQDKTLFAYVGKSNHDLFIKIDEFFSMENSPSVLKICVDKPSSSLTDIMNTLLKNMEIKNEGCQQFKFDYNLLNSVKDFLEYKAMGKSAINFPIDSDQLKTHYPANNFTLNLLNLLQNPEASGILEPLFGNSTMESTRRLLQSTISNGEIYTLDNPQVNGSQDVLKFSELLISIAAFLIFYDILYVGNKFWLWGSSIANFKDLFRGLKIDFKYDLAKKFLDFEKFHRCVKALHSTASWLFYYSIAMLSMNIYFMEYRNSKIIGPGPQNDAILGLFTIKMVTSFLDLIRCYVSKYHSKTAHINMTFLNHFIKKSIDEINHIKKTETFSLQAQPLIIEIFSESIIKLKESQKSWLGRCSNKWFDFYQHNDLKEKIKQLNKLVRLDTNNEKQCKNYIYLILQLIKILEDDHVCLFDCETKDIKEGTKEEEGQKLLKGEKNDEGIESSDEKKNSSSIEKNIDKNKPSKIQENEEELDDNLDTKEKNEQNKIQGKEDLNNSDQIQKQCAQDPSQNQPQQSKCQKIMDFCRKKPATSSEVGDEEAISEEVKSSSKFLDCLCCRKKTSEKPPILDDEFDKTLNTPKKHKCSSLWDCFKSKSETEKDNIDNNEQDFNQKDRLTDEAKGQIKQALKDLQPKEKAMVKASLLFILFTLLSKNNQLDNEFLSNFSKANAEFKFFDEIFNKDTETQKLREFSKEAFNLYQQGILGSPYEQIVIWNNWACSSTIFGLAITGWLKSN